MKSIKEQRAEKLLKSRIRDGAIFVAGGFFTELLVALLMSLGVL